MSRRVGRLGGIRSRHRPGHALQVRGPTTTRWTLAREVGSVRNPDWAAPGDPGGGVGHGHVLLARHRVAGRTHAPPGAGRANEHLRSPSWLMEARARE